MCEYYFDPSEKKILHGLNLLNNACVLPHHNSFGKTWARQLKQSVPKITLLGIDEGTGMVQESNGTWRVYGAGEVTVYSGEQVEVRKRGDAFSF